MKYVDRLFTAFQRLHGERDFKGSGIGLATVSRIIRRHHGSIWAEGEPGKGAAFFFTLTA
jgi:light-regulated signal transduction histidine kinase (bacteriophytochrome)